MHSVFKYFIEKPLVANLISILLVIIGLSALLGLKRQATPLVDMQELRVISTVPAASPKDVELNVSMKIEEALESVSGLKKYISHSSENLSIVSVFIEPDAPDIEKVKSDIRRSIESVQDFPEEMTDRPVINEIKVDDMIIYELAIVFDEYDSQKIAETSRILKRKLQKIPEIAKIKENGAPQKEVKILLNGKNLQRLQVSVNEVYMAIKNSKIRLSAGSLESSNSEKGLITVSEFENPQDLNKIVIRSTSSGQHIYLKDVAKVEEGFKKLDRHLRFNGKNGASLLIIKKSSADLITLVDKIETVRQDYLASAPDDLKIFSTWDFSTATRTRLNIVSSNFAAGFFLVLIILFLFLDPRIAMWTALGIPITIAFAVIGMPFLDITINSVSLCGMILVMGMIVDDAIIIAESIYRHMEDGLPPKEAAYLGLLAVIKPVFGTIVTSIIAFIPLYYLPGSLGDFSIEVPTIVCIMLVASLLEATLILPSHLGHRKGTINSAKRPPGSALIKRLEIIYEKALSLSLRHRTVTLAVAILMTLSASILASKFANFRMFDLDQSYRIYLMGEVQEGSSLAYTQEQVKKLEDLLRTLPQYEALESVKFTVGEEGSFKGTRFLSKTSFLGEIVMKPFNQRELKALELYRWIKDQVSSSPELGFVSFDLEIDSEGPPVGRPIEIRIIGDEDRVRTKIIETIEKILKELPVSEVTADNTSGKELLHIKPKYEALSESGLDVSTVANAIRTILDGQIVGDLQTNTENIDYRLQMDKRFLDFNDPLKGVVIRNQFGNLIPLKGLVEEQSARSLKKIMRYNGEPSNLITANLKEGASTSQVYQEIKHRLKELEKNYPNYSLLIGGEAEESEKFVTQILTLLVLAIIGIYFWLILQLESLTQPFMVVLAIPFGLIGILMAFMIHSYDLSLLALVGIVGVGGVLVNDSLIMVDFINRIKGNVAKTLDHAIIEGAKKRFRPIVLTTLTTVIGLFPTAYGLIGGTDSFISPLVFAMTWGLLIGTPSILIVIPVLYSVVIGFTSKFSTGASSR